MAMKFGVSLYSYQVAYANKKMNLEDCLKEVRALPSGADGIEVLADRSGRFPQMPYKGTLTAEDQEKWKELNQKYGTKPNCYSSTIYDKRFPMLGHYRHPEKEIFEEQLGWLKDDIDFCADFGFPIMRVPLLYGFFDEVIGEGMRYAADQGIKLCMEIHAPLEITGEFVTSYAEMVDKIGVHAGGFIPDFGLFQTGLPAPLVRTTLKKGGDPELVERIKETFEAHGDLEGLEAEIHKATDNEAVRYLARYAKGYVAHKPADMRDIAKYIHHVHAKFYEVDENYKENGIDFEGALKTLVEMGYDGYLNTEYEGQLFMDPEEADEVEQVRRQHVMTCEMLKKIG